MTYRSSNLVTGRQLRAARTLAGMTQRDLATVLGLNERAVRFWERKHDRRPTSAPNDARIEQALLAHGVILFAEPTPGARLGEKRLFSYPNARARATGNRK
jgi:transcriptional regulator with XRE-family HTH domain